MTLAVLLVGVILSGFALMFGLACTRDSTPAAVAWLVGCLAWVLIASPWWVYAFGSLWGCDMETCGN